MNDASPIYFFARIFVSKIIRSDGGEDYPALNDVELTIDEKGLSALHNIYISGIWNFHYAYFYPTTFVVNLKKARIIFFPRKYHLI